jgi:hypothetical protein
MKTWVMFQTSGDDGWGKKCKKSWAKKSAKKEFFGAKKIRA